MTLHSLCSRLLQAGVLAALAALLWAPPLAAAGDTPPDTVEPGAPSVSEADEKLVRNRVLRYTAMITNSSGGAATEIPPATIHPIHDPVELLCPRDTAGPCTFEAQIFVQVSGEAANNSYAVCTTLDGVYLEPWGCPFLGMVPQGGYWAGNSFTSALSGVQRGRRTVQSFIYMQEGGSLANRSVVYRIYKPN